MKSLTPSGYISTILLVAALFLFICPLSFGQQGESPQATPPNSLQKGSWSLQFELDNNFQPRTFQGSILNIKRHYSDRTAVRLGVSVGVDIRDEDGDVNFINPDYLGRVSEIDRDINSSSCDLLLHYLFYPLPKSDMHLFLGAGPHFGFAYRNDDYIIEQADEMLSSKTISSLHNTSWTFGASGVIGVEWFLRHNVSLLAEYGILLDYRWENRENNRSTYPGGQIIAEESKIHGFNVGGRPVKFGISAYF